MRLAVRQIAARRLALVVRLVAGGVERGADSYEEEEGREVHGGRGERLGRVALWDTAGCRLPAAGCWLLAASCWLLAAGRAMRRAWQCVEPGAGRG